jgi:hypothetical protein
MSNEVHTMCFSNNIFQDYGVRVMGFNATFNNISVTGISWRPVLLVEETGVPAENHRPTTSHWQKLSHNIVSSTPDLCGIIYNYSLLLRSIRVFIDLKNDIDF